MARKFQIKRGLKANMPELAQGELAMTTDTGSEGLFIGTGTGTNVEFARKDDLEAAGGAFIAIYDTTSLADIQAAIAAGKTVMLNGPDGDYTGCAYLTDYNDTQVLFVKSENDGTFFLGCNSDGWWTYTSKPSYTAGEVGAMPSDCVNKYTGDVTDLLGTENCRYIFSNDVTGMPIDNEWWFVDTISSTSTDIVVIAYPALTSPCMYVKIAANSVWGDWRQVPLTTSDGTVTSENADYAEVGEWADGNTSSEDRIGYFVAIDETSPGRTMVKATSTADVRGVTVTAPAFAGGYSADKVGEDGNLLAKYDFVAVMGIVSVIDNGTCTVNERCMPGDDGTAVPSTNNLGYHVMERVDDTHVLIAVEPGADMIQRIKTDVSELQNKSDVFIATYGTTTSAEIEAAYQAGKVVYVEKGVVILRLVQRRTNMVHVFMETGEDGSLVCCVCMSNTWFDEPMGYIPATHASTHASGGTDPITPASIGADASGSAAQALADAKSYTDQKFSAIPTPDPTSIIEQNKGLAQKFWRGTKAEYEAVETKSDDTMYIITDDDGTVEAPGDMNASVYDPQGKAQDIFAYVDSAIQTAVGNAMNASY